MAQVRRLGDVSSSRAQPAFQEDDVDAAIASGDRLQAFSLLMTRYGDQAYRYALAVLGDPAQAEEVRQQAFVEAYRDLPRFAGRSPVRVWLLKIVRNRCLDLAKATKRWGARFKNEPSTEPEIEAPGPGDQLDRARVARWLVDCLSTLAPAAREAVLLRYQQELSYDEAAAIIGDRSGTLQQRVSRALPVLRRCIEARLREGGSE